MINARDELKFVTDQKSCPTYAPGVAKALIAMADAILDGKTNGFGTFHLCGEGPANRFEFVQAIMAAYAPYTDKRPRILPAVSADFPQAAKRPAYSVLDCTKTFDIYGIRQKPWRDGLDQAIQAFMHHYVG
jgi:dTDP-4-dehydrorhamnose reductase